MAHLSFKLKKRNFVKVCELKNVPECHSVRKGEKIFDICTLRISYRKRKYIPIYTTFVFIPDRNRNRKRKIKWAFVLVCVFLMNIYLPLSHSSEIDISDIFVWVMSLCEAKKSTTSRFSFLIGTISNRHQNGVTIN